MSRQNTIRRISYLLILTLLVAGGCDQLGLSSEISTIPTLPPTPTDVPPSPTPTPTNTLTPSVTPSPLPTDTVPPCDETTGQIIYTSFVSQITGEEFHYRVYLPPCYTQTERRYPYIIMLHGLGEGMDDGQWERIGLPHAADLGFARGSLPPMIIVMPNGIDAQHAYDPGPYPEVIVKELIPAIEQQFCTWNTSATRAIGGLSRGGYWAYGIAFTYPELFDRVGGHSAYFYEGDYSPFNPYNMIDTASSIERLTMYLDHGLNDSIVDENMLSFVNLLRRRGIEPNYIINPVGNHSEEYWSAHTADYLTFYAAEWPRDVEQFPSCHAPSPSESDQP